MSAPIQSQAPSEQLILYLPDTKDIDVLMHQLAKKNLEKSPDKGKFLLKKASVAISKHASARYKTQSVKRADEKLEEADPSDFFINALAFSIIRSLSKL
ncbi:MAG: hypothetical protein WAM28_04600 [Chlamydiales bacterium]